MVGTASKEKVESIELRDVGSILKVGGHIQSGVPSQAKKSTMQAERGNLPTKM